MRFRLSERLFVSTEPCIRMMTRDIMCSPLTHEPFPLSISAFIMVITTTRSDALMTQGQVLPRPIGHELTIQEVPSLEEQKEVTHKTNYFERLVTQAMSVLGALDREIMSAALMKFSEGGKLDNNSISKHSTAIQTLYEELEVQRCVQDFKSMKISGQLEEEKTSS